MHPTIEQLQSLIDSNEQTIADLRRENAELTQWKESAISVFPPVQEIAKELGNVGLGESIHDKILPGIQKLKVDLTAAREALRKAKEDLKQARGDNALINIDLHAVKGKFVDATIRAQSSGWVDFTQKMPSQEDSDEYERVLWRKSGQCLEPNHWNWGRPNAEPTGWFWLPLRPLPTPPPSPEERETLIITNHVFPPIPIRTHDWSAYRDGYEAGDPIGWGETKEAAIADLKEQEGEA